MAPPPDQLSYFFTAVAPQADWFRGEDGYHYDLKISPSDEGRLSQTGYVAYRIQHRRDEFSLLLRSGRLFQQYLVGMWAAADQNRLSYLCRHQSDIRATQVRTHLWYLCWDKNRADFKEVPG